MHTRNKITALAILFCGVHGAFADSRPAFRIPGRLYAAPGVECNVYFGSSFDTDSLRAWSFDVEGNVGMCQNERWTWTPDKKDAGSEHRLVFRAWSDFAAMVARTVTVEVARLPVGTERKVTFALLGDSLTNCRYQDRILAVMRQAGWTAFTPVGSRSGSSCETVGVYREGEAAHDGYGGFTPDSFLTRFAVAFDEIENVNSEAEREQLKAFGEKIEPGREWARGLLRSPFVKLVNGRKTLDIQGWLDRVNGGNAPDYILIELGVNGNNGQQIPGMRRLMGEIRKVAPKAVIAIAACLVGADQDAYGKNYGCTLSAVRCRRDLFLRGRLLESFVEELNAAGDRNVFFVPFGSAIDPVYGYIRQKSPVFAGSDVLVERIVNAVHPSVVGGKQLGDAVSAFLLAHLSRDMTSFDTASAWVTGVKFAWGANRDRKTPPPSLVVKFKTAAGELKKYIVGEVIFKNRHYLQRRFSAEELAELKGAHYLGFEFEGLTHEDEGVSFSGERIFREEFSELPVHVRPKRNLTPLANQNVGNNTGAGRLPFPVREKTVQPIAASAKKVLPTAPQFTGGAVKG